jgi:hypothetical protein
MEMNTGMEAPKMKPGQMVHLIGGGKTVAVLGIEMLSRRHFFLRGMDRPIKFQDHLEDGSLRWAGSRWVLEH